MNSDRRTYVQVVQLQLRQTLVQGLLDVVGVVLGIPQLGGDEDILALQPRDILVGAFDPSGNLSLILVDGGQVEMTVAGLESLVNSLTNLTGIRLPSAKAQLAVVRVSYTRVPWEGSSGTYGNWAPELRVIFLLSDMLTVDSVRRRERSRRGC